ncbi:uncharacterized protein LY89DRAFT_690056 [Mollisia scopiformis]|uniref:Uncharacterized protein n=1 Tax=Mollisia scopiformis TaxID=149040 RepID=A0A132BCJ1_MOLSC|nr:uncharacterized protein LY89DRAFT_690056 [Mollisia scopiformis]KUJ09574.1 hypothetical protein LY89DRAFT_690056 [Mollisia scopiformis]
MRNKIYEILLLEDHEIDFDKQRRPLYDLRSLSLVNKQVSNEARWIYFSINTFRLETGFLSINSPIQFLRRIPIKCAPAVRRLTFTTFLGIKLQPETDVLPKPRKFDPKNITEVSRAVDGYLKKMTDARRAEDMANYRFDINDQQRLNIGSLHMAIRNHFPHLASLNIEFIKVSFVPFSLYAADGILGDNAAELAHLLQPLFKFPEFRKITLVQKSDVKLDWLAEKIREAREAPVGVVKVVQA